MGEGVLAEEGPVVAVGRRNLAHHRHQVVGEVRNAGAEAAQHVQALGDAHGEGVGGKLVQVLVDQPDGLGALAVGEAMHDPGDLLLFP